MLECDLHHTHRVESQMQHSGGAGIRGKLSCLQEINHTCSKMMFGDAAEMSRDG